jgi:hypothetical protein
MNTDPIHWPVSRYLQQWVCRWVPVAHETVHDGEAGVCRGGGRTRHTVLLSTTDHMVLSSSKPTFSLPYHSSRPSLRTRSSTWQNESNLLLSHTWKTLSLSFLPKSSAAVTHYESAIRSRRKRCRISKN